LHRAAEHFRVCNHELMLHSLHWFFSDFDRPILSAISFNENIIGCALPAPQELRNDPPGGLSGEVEIFDTNGFYGMRSTYTVF